MFLNNLLRQILPLANEKGKNVFWNIFIRQRNIWQSKLSLGKPPPSVYLLCKNTFFYRNTKTPFLWSKAKLASSFCRWWTLLRRVLLIRAGFTFSLRSKVYVFLCSDYLSLIFSEKTQKNILASLVKPAPPEPFLFRYNYLIHVPIFVSVLFCVSFRFCPVLFSAVVFRERQNRNSTPSLTYNRREGVELDKQSNEFNLIKARYKSSFFIWFF